MQISSSPICKHCDLPIRETHMGHVRNEWEHMNGLSFCADNKHWAWPKEDTVIHCTPEHTEAVKKLRRIMVYLRDTNGRTETEAPRRVLTAASKIVGTDKVVDLNQRNIKARLK